MTRHLFLAALGLGVLSGCVPTAVGAGSNLAVHEVQLSGDASQRLIFAYGDIVAGQTVPATFGGKAVQLSRGDAVGGPLYINNGPIYTDSLQSTVNLPKVTRTAQGLFDVTGNAGFNQLYYTDGRSWFRLSGVTGSRLSARLVSGLEGVGELTSSEAAYLSRSLSAMGPLVVGVLPSDAAPNRRLSVSPNPTEYRLTALSVMRVQDSSVARPTPTATRPPSSTTGATVNYTVLDKGSNAAADSSTVQVATTPAQVAALYNLAYGRQSARPNLPDVGGKTLVGIFMGTRATGGYSLNIEQVDVSGNLATIKVRESSPRPDMLTTQALTSPWVIVSLPRRFADVQVQGLGRSSSAGGIEK